MDTDREQQEVHESSSNLGWLSVPLWIVVLIFVFRNQLESSDPVDAVFQVLFPAILLGAITARLLAKSKAAKS